VFDELAGEGFTPMSDDDRQPEAERSAFSGICAQCREPFRGRRDKRFCRDACRAQASRLRRMQALAATIARLTALAGVKA
jgi:hypothetical protein